MKKVVVAAVVAVAFTASAVAQDFQPPELTEQQIADAVTLIEDLELEEESYRDLWCGAAFIIISQYLRAQGDETSASEAETAALTLFTRVETALIPQNLTGEQLNAIGESASIIAISQMGEDGAADYGEEECSSAAGR